jgi:hypothetical protein
MLTLRKWIPFAALAAYAAILLIWTYPLVFNATTHTSIPVGGLFTGFQANDQIGNSVSAAGRHAGSIIDGDFRRLIDQKLCYPTPKSGTFGPHMIELGILSVPAFAISRNPILAYNTACFAIVLIAAMSMFALVRYWTGSAVAAFVAGLLFAFEPRMMPDLTHPMLSIHWFPAVIFFFERLLAKGRAIDALLLFLCASMQTLVGGYPLFTLCSFALPYGLIRLIQQRGSLDASRLGLLTAAAAGTSTVIAYILGSFSSSNEVWKVLQPRNTFLASFSGFLPGGEFAIGIVALLLAALLVVAWRKRRGPVFAILMGTLFCVAISSRGPLWPGGHSFEGLYFWLADRLWILGVVRVPARIAFGVFFGSSLLAGIGLAAGMEKISTNRLQKGLLLLGVSGVILAETFHPTLGPMIHGRWMSLKLIERTPHPDVAKAYQVFDLDDRERPILDIPYDASVGVVFQMPKYSLMSAYHQRPTAACYSSHFPPSFFNVSRMAGRLPSRRAIEELAAAGFEDVVYHHGLAPEPFAKLVASPDVDLLYRSVWVSSFRFKRPKATQSDPRSLVAIGIQARIDDFQSWKRTLLDIEIRNTAKEVWVLPHPIRPEVAKVRWWSADGRETSPWVERRMMLPLALSSGATDRVSLNAGAPPSAAYCDPEVVIPSLNWTLRATEEPRGFCTPMTRQP